jgi:hypothetical protein
MAVALNVFKTVRGTITTNITDIYTPEIGYTGIVLMAQIANVTGATAQVTVTTRDLANTEVELLKNFSVPGNDAVSATMGKLVIAEGTQLRVSASNGTALKYTLSILESAK